MPNTHIVNSVSCIRLGCEGAPSKAITASKLHAWHAHVMMMIGWALHEVQCHTALVRLTVITSMH